MSANVILHTSFENLRLFKNGKVRDMYDLGDHYLMVSTDRLSAFDVIMNQGIPEKGKILTQVSKFWFDYTKDIIDNHLVSTDVNEYPDSCREYSEKLIDRSMLVKKAKLIPLECIVRGYISGSGWIDYVKNKSICGIKLPEGLRDSDKLPEPIFTPSTKADLGDHDENISEEKAKNIVGEERYEFIKTTALKVYKMAYDFAYQKGIIIADTKMEFGIYQDRIILIDELLTPDSSRFWPLDRYEPGRTQDSYDKQYVRNYLISINFNKQPPAPDLPDEVIANTAAKYKEVSRKLTNEMN